MISKFKRLKEHNLEFIGNLFCKFEEDMSTYKKIMEIKKLAKKMQNEMSLLMSTDYYLAKNEKNQMENRKKSQQFQKKESKTKQRDRSRPPQKPRIFLKKRSKSQQQTIRKCEKKYGEIRGQLQRKRLVFLQTK